MALPNFKDRRKISKLFIRGSNSLFIVLLAITVGSLFIIVTGKNPLEFLVLSFKGAFGNLYAVSNFIAKMIPLTFTGLAVAIAFRHHLFNIGMEGQLYLGALAATWMGITFGNLPAALLLPLIIIGAFLAGALGGLIPGILKTKFNVHEAVSTIFLNSIFILFVSFLLYGPMKDPLAQVFPLSSYISHSARLPVLISGTNIHFGLIIALGCAFIMNFILSNTTFGYKSKAIGSNPISSNYAGINVSKNIILLLAISGGIAGLGGMSEILGFHHRLMTGFSPGYGFLGITVGILGRFHPLGVIFGAFLVSFLLVGTKAATYALEISAYFAYALAALVILFYFIFEYLRK